MYKILTCGYFNKEDMKIESVFLDTSFFIRLFKKDDPNHKQARAYLDRFLQDEISIYTSTIVAAEFGVKSDIDLLPFRVVKMLSFDLEHARIASRLARAAFDSKRKGVVILENRVIIPNDTKLIAQSEAIQAAYFVGKDDNAKAVIQFLQDQGLIRFTYLDISIPVAETYGELF